eukprot:13816491-Heterocapsa_arctica.AAC.1
MAEVVDARGSSVCRKRSLAFLARGWKWCSVRQFHVMKVTAWARLAVIHGASSLLPQPLDVSRGDGRAR